MNTRFIRVYRLGIKTKIQFRANFEHILDKKCHPY